MQTRIKETILANGTKIYQAQWNAGWRWMPNWSRVGHNGTELDDAKAAIDLLLSRQKDQDNYIKYP